MQMLMRDMLKKKVLRMEDPMGNYLSTTNEERQEMLKVIGKNEIDELFECIPDPVKRKHPLTIPYGKSELEVSREVSQIAKKNIVFSSVFRGAGSYNHYIPAIVRSVTSKEEFVTAYTPYQAEVSQGILQSIFEYQTMICQLTGMDVSNASVYDGATAAAEAITMCKDRKHKKAYISATANPGVIKTIQTYCHGNGTEVIIVPEKEGETDFEYLKSNLQEEAACLYIQQPNYYGIIENAELMAEVIHRVKGKLIMGVNPISLGILKTPKECGADIAVGEGQPLGIPMAFGGPYLGFMTCTADLTRKLPGRIVGQTVDNKGNRAFVLTLQAREQHIRREKAGSNICSNEALCALMASVYMAAMGNYGIKEVGKQCISKARYLASELEKAGFSLLNRKEFFHEFITDMKGHTAQAMKALEDKGILGGLPLHGTYEGKVLWCCTEMNTKEEMDEVVRTLKEVVS